MQTAQKIKRKSTFLCISSYSRFSSSERSVSVQGETRLKPTLSIQNKQNQSFLLSWFCFSTRYRKIRFSRNCRTCLLYTSTAWMYQRLPGSFIFTETHSFTDSTSCRRAPVWICVCLKMRSHLRSRWWLWNIWSIWRPWSIDHFTDRGARTAWGRDRH